MNLSNNEKKLLNKAVAGKVSAIKTTLEVFESALGIDYFEEPYTILAEKVIALRMEYEDYLELQNKIISEIEED